MDLNLAKILEEHEKWFDSMGENGEKADLRGVQINEADFCGVKLIEADLQGAILQKANFQNADLRGANLQDAVLADANFQKANLEEVDFMWSNLQRASFHEAFFNGSYLQGADLRNAQGLTLEQVVFAQWDEDTQFPEDIKKLLS